MKKGNNHLRFTKSNAGHRFVIKGGNMHPAKLGKRGLSKKSRRRKR